MTQPKSVLSVAGETGSAIVVESGAYGPKQTSRDDPRNALSTTNEFKGGVPCPTNSQTSHSTTLSSSRKTEQPSQQPGEMETTIFESSSSTRTPETSTRATEEPIAGKKLSDQMPAPSVTESMNQGTTISPSTTSTERTNNRTARFVGAMVHTALRLLALPLVIGLAMLQQRKPATVRKIEQRLAKYNWVISDEVMAEIERESRDHLKAASVQGLGLREEDADFVEAGRFLFGTMEGDRIVISASVPMPIEGFYRGPVLRTKMDKERAMAIIREQQERGLLLVGNWHFHPGEISLSPTFPEDFKFNAYYGSTKVSLVIITKFEDGKVAKTFWAAQHFGEEKELVMDRRLYFIPGKGLMAKGDRFFASCWIKDVGDRVRFAQDSKPASGSGRVAGAVVAGLLVALAPFMMGAGLPEDVSLGEALVPAAIIAAVVAGLAAFAAKGGEGVGVAAQQPARIVAAYPQLGKQLVGEGGEPELAHMLGDEFRLIKGFDLTLLSEFALTPDGESIEDLIREGVDRDRSLRDYLRLIDSFNKGRRAIWVSVGDRKSLGFTRSNKENGRIYACAIEKEGKIYYVIPLALYEKARSNPYILVNILVKLYGMEALKRTHAQACLDELKFTFIPEDESEDPISDMQRTILDDMAERHEIRELVVLFHTMLDIMRRSKTGFDGDVTAAAVKYAFSLIAARWKEKGSGFLSQSERDKITTRAEAVAHNLHNFKHIFLALPLIVNLLKARGISFENLALTTREKEILAELSAYTHKEVNTKLGRQLIEYAKAYLKENKHSAKMAVRPIFDRYRECVIRHGEDEEDLSDELLLALDALLMFHLEDLVNRFPTDKPHQEFYDTLKSIAVKISQALGGTEAEQSNLHKEFLRNIEEMRQ
ncbi:MAG: hypothetical protein WC513_09820, partial [Bacteroidales bacterium]